MTAYYNEIDPYAAQWLRNLIEAGHLAPGYVDERSIEDVKPDDLAGFTQCHFFAGIGVWSLALRRAGWPDSRPVWTGSCPCQPFSAAGKGNRFADERHLWPAWFHLITQCAPECLFGEQVASKDANPWIDLVQTDLEAMGYAIGAVPFPSASIGAPHIRDRLYWVGHTTGERCGEAGQLGCGPAQRAADAGSESSRLANMPIGRRREERADAGRLIVGDCAQGRTAGFSTSCSNLRPGPTNGYWRDADWLFCRDGKWRPVEPGTFPLVNGAPARVGRVCADQERIAEIPQRKDQGSRAGRLRAYGNAINAEQAQIFIECYLDVIDK